MSQAIPMQSTVYFPSPVSSLASIGGTSLWHMTVVEPISATRCSIRRTLYTTKPDVQGSNHESQVTELEAEFYAMVKQLETQFQEIVETKETIALSPSQEELQQLIQTHLRKEREAGRKVTPALPLQISSEVNGSNCGIAERRM